MAGTSPARVTIGGTQALLIEIAPRTDACIAM